MNLSRVRVTFIHSGESVVATPSGTYEQVGDEIVIRHADGTVVARLARDQVQVSATRAEADFERIINIRRQADGSWTAHPQPPFPPTTTFVTGGWSEISRLRTSLGALEHFKSDEYELFVREFGEPPA
jgi:hypothetical protein